MICPHCGEPLAFVEKKNSRGTKVRRLECPGPPKWVTPWTADDAGQISLNEGVVEVAPPKVAQPTSEPI